MDSDLRSRRNFLSFLSFAIGIFHLAAAWASPPCVDGIGNELQIDNSRILKFKSSTPNQFLSRGMISGVVQDRYADRRSHYHFQVKIGPKPGDTLELIYNIHFGAINRIIPGMNVIACGDYITSNAPTEVYEPSPDGAILHWLHYSPRPERHPHGWLELDGEVFGD